MKITIDNKEINYFIINESGKIIETGEEEGFDTFTSVMVDLKSIEKDKHLKICFNHQAKGRYCDLEHAYRYNEIKLTNQKPEAVWLELNYKTLCIE